MKRAQRAWCMVLVWILFALVGKGREGKGGKWRGSCLGSCVVGSWKSGGYWEAFAYVRVRA